MIKKLIMFFALFVTGVSSAEKSQNIYVEENNTQKIQNNNEVLNDKLEKILNSFSINSDILNDFDFETKTDEMLIYETGIASFYGKRWNGRKTANGEIFDTSKLTAAHKTLPFGTRVKVINHSNGKEVEVVINDRGPFIKGRIIDLTEAAFKKIENLNKGITSVSILVIE